MWDLWEADVLSGFLLGSSSHCHAGSSALQGKPRICGHEQHRVLRQTQTTGCPHPCLEIVPRVVPAPPGLRHKGKEQSRRPDPALCGPTVGSCSFQGNRLYQRAVGGGHQLLPPTPATPCATVGMQCPLAQKLPHCLSGPASCCKQNFRERKLGL